MRPPAAPSAPAPAEEPRAPRPRRGAAVPALVIACALAGAACSGPPAPDPEADREALLAAVDSLWDAYANQDLETLGRLYSEEAVQIGEKRVEGRAAILGFLRDWYKGLQIQGWEHTQRSARLMGDLAVVSYWQEETGLLDGRPYRVAGWVSDVWVKRDGSWINLLSHIGANQAPPPGVEE